MNETNFHEIRCIVCDMDGTLLNDDKQLDEGIRDVVAQLRKRDIIFTLASGRNVQIMKQFVEELDIKSAYIVNNGACIYQDNQCLFEQAMDCENIIKAFEIYKEENISYIAYTSNAIYVCGDEEPLHTFLNRLKGKSKICYNVAHTHIAKQNVFKVVAINKNQTDMERIRAKINRTCETLQCLRSEDHIYTITHKRASKGIALQWILDNMGIPLQHTLVFGDNFNDVSMFEIAGIAVAMENGQEDLKAHAHFITMDNNHQGVSRFIKERILK